MEKDTAKIKCPNCGTEINVSDVLYHQLEDKIRVDFEQQAALKDKEVQKKIDKLEADKKTFQDEKHKQVELVEQAVQSKLKDEKPKLEKSIRTKVEEEKSNQLKTLEDELKAKSEQVKELNSMKAEISRLKREKDELRGAIEAEEAEKYNNNLATEKEKIKTAESEKSKTELQKRDKLIEDLNKRLEEAQTKLEQGSNKLSGEVKEIELREYLKVAFPIDEIKDVPSGITGADVFHLVKNTVGQLSGSILYERKQTQKFEEKWISKLKEDGRVAKADICIIVTRAMPKDKEETHFRDGVWVCTFSDIGLITALLRDGLIKQYAALTSQAGKGTKMEMLYDYLRGNDFQNHILGMLDAFKKMDKLLQKEKDDAIKKFAERESHIFQAKQSILNFWGRVDGIATDSLSNEVKMLDTNGQQQLT